MKEFVEGALEGVGLDRQPAYGLKLLHQIIAQGWRLVTAAGGGSWRLSKPPFESARSLLVSGGGFSQSQSTISYMPRITWRIMDRCKKLKRRFGFIRRKMLRC